MDIIIYGIILFLGIILGFLLGKFKYSGKIEYTQVDIDTLRNEKIRFETESKSFKELYESKEIILKEEQAKIQTLQMEKTRLEEMSRMNSEKLSKQEEERKTADLKLKEDFSKIANEVLVNNSNKFSEQTSNSLQTLLKPFRENLQQFEKKVDENLLKQLTDTTQLKEQIKTLQDSNQKISTDANNLATALRGNSKTRGTWGEGILEKILEMSGLRLNQDYELQKSHAGEDNQRLIPDAIVKLPGNRHVIIDSKVSLVAYDKFISAKNEIEEALFIKEHLDSLTKHISDLSKKDYTQIDGSHLDFTMLFVPIEPSLELAYKHRPSLYNEAFAKNILLITPTTLIATLRMISVIWKQEKQNKNVQEIAKQATSMLDKFTGFVKDMDGIGEALQKVDKTYENAYKKLSTGNGNLITQAKKLAKLGAGSSKQNLLGDIDEEEEE